MALYDYGKTQNIKKYGSPNAPELNLSRIETPTALFVGTEDNMVSPVDALWLRQ